jgi:hypothetical protein
MKPSRDEALRKFRQLVREARRDWDLPKGTKKMNQAFRLDEAYHFTEKEKEGLPGPIIFPKRHITGQSSI